MKETHSVYLERAVVVHPKVHPFVQVASSAVRLQRSPAGSLYQVII